MQELGGMMRAIELQKMIEDKVTEWRQRSARVAGGGMVDSYQQPVNFKRHTNRRKNSAEINKIIAKYSKPNKRADERYNIVQKPKSPPPVRPERTKKLKSSGNFSKSVDNLATIDMNPNPANMSTNFHISKYKLGAKSHEDLRVFVDVNHNRKSANFDEKSIMENKLIGNKVNVIPKKIPEEIINYEDFKNNDIRKRCSIATSTPISKKKMCSEEDDKVNDYFKKCTISSVSDLKKGSSEPNILSASVSKESLNSTKTVDYRKKWKMLKPPFRKGAFDCLLLWKIRKSKNEQTK